MKESDIEPLKGVLYRKLVACSASDWQIAKVMEAVNATEVEKETQVTDPGKKFDDEKLPYHLLPTDAIEEIVKVLQHGAKKYQPRNWEKGMKWSRPFSAMMRHSLAWWRGEDLDPETKLPHMAHAGCCVLFLISYSIRQNAKSYDDRERIQVKTDSYICEHGRSVNCGEPLEVFCSECGKN